MIRSVRVPVENPLAWRWQAVDWAMTYQPQGTSFVALLNNNELPYPNDPFPNRLFIGAKRVVSFTGSDSLTELYQAHAERPSYLVGFLSYDLKNQLEPLSSRNPNRTGFPDIYFAEPEWIIDFEERSILIQSHGDPTELLHHIETHVAAESPSAEPCYVQCRVTPDEYQATVRRIQQHIRAGDVYELNYCIEFFAQKERSDTRPFNPLATYQALNERSPMPFSNFLKIDNHYVMGASPERFLKKEGQTILSQPIKGTIRRGQTPEEDLLLRSQLLQSEKERAENLMIVDLVRNDLARSAQTGSVQVDELFGIYGFRQVYQMISTVSATLRPGVFWMDALRNAFPMGSMTGAPKIRSMQLIDELEVSRRGVYSGAIGYVTPAGDFDFSVVIRTLLYNAQNQYLSFSVGSAITYDSDPVQEWEECLLKAKAIREVLEGSR
ncbi:aminodeoxychorismate synthase component I [Spirosoma sp. BT702]|uniref:aminodeoxychorismate synthase n=1 Tax=Spirosoma profusum TaxID=2771354 RepID=A0A926XTK0_9BACT|nr:aminodeoxychorismate synthase component I [Spirosoma profusum]MBD2699265.1 aminodeoxychorismate synthase component I [Spirosoma profusum]